MTERKNTKLVVLVAMCCFVLYVIVTVVQMFPTWRGLSGTESFALVKHLAVVLGIAAFLFAKPRLGSLVAVAWGAIVPFERYRLLVAELLQGSLLDSGALAPLDTARLFLLLIGTCMSVFLIYQLHVNKKKSEVATSANA